MSRQRFVGICLGGRPALALFAGDSAVSSVDGRPEGRQLDGGAGGGHRREMAPSHRAPILNRRSRNGKAQNQPSGACDYGIRIRAGRP